MLVKLSPGVNFINVFREFLYKSYILLAFSSQKKHFRTKKRVKNVNKIDTWQNINFVYISWLRILAVRPVSMSA